MLDFVRWVISRREQSKGTARQRLQVALMRDRFDLSPDILASLKRDVLTAVSRYMVVGEDDIQEFEILRKDESVFLVSNIRVRELQRWAPVR